MPSHDKRGERGNAMVEFALCAAFLAPVMAATFTIGMSLVRAIQGGQVCRNANILAVRGINLAQADNQSLVVRTARGLGMNVTGSDSPDPNGKGVVILTKVYRVGANDCLAVGLQADAGHCPNLNNYVISNRVSIGNAALLASAIGNPASSQDSYGNIDLQNDVQNTGDRASGFPDPAAMSAAAAATGLLYLDPGGYAFIAEATFDISSLNLFSLFNAPRIYARNVS